MLIHFIHVWYWGDVHINFTNLKMWHIFVQYTFWPFLKHYFGSAYMCRAMNNGASKMLEYVNLFSYLAKKSLSQSHRRYLYNVTILKF